MAMPAHLEKIQNIVDPLPIIPMDISIAELLRLPLFVFRPLLFRFDDAMRSLDFVRRVVASEPLGEMRMQAKGAVRQGCKMRVQSWEGARLGVSAGEEELAHHVIRRFDGGMGGFREDAGMPTEDTARPAVEVDFDFVQPPSVRCARCEVRILHEAA